MSSIDPLIYKSHHSFTITNDDFTIKVASTLEDIKKAQSLRHQVFLEEGLGKTHETGLDFDDYDKIADHLVIIDNTTGLAVGTYRLIHSEFSNVFYSQGEFLLDEFLKIPGGKLEMGRACIHENYRTGRTMDLLWQGLSKYINESRARYLFGCSSFFTTDAHYIFAIMKSLSNDGKMKSTYNISPTPEYYWPQSDELYASAAPIAGYSKELPPLLRSYLNAGSHVHGFPAYDKDFLCFDLFTILDMTTLNKKYAARYGPFT